MLLPLPFNITLKILATIIARKRNEMHKDRKRKTAIICRRHNCAYEKLYEFYPKSQILVREFKEVKDSRSR